MSILPFRAADDIDREISGSAFYRLDGAIQLDVSGLRAERKYARAVIYALPCMYVHASTAESGLDAIDHQAYRVDPGAAATGQNRVELTISATGYGRLDSTYLRLDAQSLVFFRDDPQAGILPVACADLTHEGAYRDLATHNSGGEPYPVTVVLTRSRTRTTLDASVSFIGGSQAKATFTVQRRSCSDRGSAEMSYLIDPGGSADDPANRIQLEVFGTGQVQSIAVEHAARVDALSVKVLTPSYSPRCLDLF